MRNKPHVHTREYKARKVAIIGESKCCCCDLLFKTGEKIVVLDFGMDCKENTFAHPKCWDDQWRLLQQKKWAETYTKCATCGTEVLKTQISHRDKLE